MKISNTHIECETCKIRGKCIYSNLELCHLKEVSENRNTNFYKKGTVIFHEHNYPLGMYGIYEGRVKIYKTTENGREHILSLAREGEVLGYRSLISGEKYEVSAMAIEDSQVCFVSKNTFMGILSKSNNLTSALMKLLSEDLRAAEDKIADMAQKTVKERSAETILMLGHYYGYETDEKTIAVSLTREEIANLVGTATETLIRTLSEFKKNKVIDLKGKKIIVLNTKLLEKIANTSNY